MELRNSNSKLRLQGRIDRQTHNVSDLQEAADGDYESLSREEKLELARRVEPTEQDTVYNVTTDRLHEYFVDNLDPDNSNPEANLSVEWLGLGTGGDTGTATSDTQLNSQAYTEVVTDIVDNGKDLLASTFLDSTEGNESDFDELGLFTGDPDNISNEEVFLINHATFAAVTKDDTKTVTFDVTLSFSDV